MATVVASEAASNILFTGKPLSRLVSSPKSPLIAASRDKASSIGYAVLDGTIPRVAIARSKLKQARHIADRLVIADLFGDLGQAIRPTLAHRCQTSCGAEGFADVDVRCSIG